VFARGVTAVRYEDSAGSGLGDLIKWLRRVWWCEKISWCWRLFLGGVEHRETRRSQPENSGKDNSDSNCCGRCKGAQ